MGRPGRGNVGHFAVALCAIAFLAGPTTAGASGGWYDWPGMKKCDQFRAGDLIIKAYASKSTADHAALSCRKANRIMRAWWRGPNAGGRHPDGFPDWHCDSGSGGGSCTRGDRIAGYQNKVA